jgi:hypothetical protein
MFQHVENGLLYHITNLAIINRCEIYWRRGPRGIFLSIIVMVNIIWYLELFKHITLEHVENGLLYYITNLAISIGVKACSRRTFCNLYNIITPFPG